MFYGGAPYGAQVFYDLKVILLGEIFRFYPDAGFFSKKMFVFGSQVFWSALDLEAGKTLLEGGWGYGPRGISLAKVQGVKVTMMDINSRASDSATQKDERNKVEATIFQSKIDDKVTVSFDYMNANPPIRAGKKVVHQGIEEAYHYLSQGGNLTIVIQKQQ